MSTAAQERAWSMVVPHHASGARLARQRLAAELQGLVNPAILGDTVAVVAELLGNAVSHAGPLPGGVIHLVCRVLDAAHIQVRVTDGGAHQVPAARSAAVDAVNGRGLTIVAALAHRWGVEREAEGAQCVWADLVAPSQ